MSLDWGCVTGSQRCISVQVRCPSRFHDLRLAPLCNMGLCAECSRAGFLFLEHALPAARAVSVSPGYLPAARAVSVYPGWLSSCCQGGVRVPWMTVFLLPGRCPSTLDVFKLPGRCATGLHIFGVLGQRFLQRKSAMILAFVLSYHDLEVAFYFCVCKHRVPLWPRVFTQAPQLLLSLLVFQEKRSRPSFFLIEMTSTIQLFPRSWAWKQL